MRVTGLLLTICMPVMAHAPKPLAPCLSVGLPYRVSLPGAHVSAPAGPHPTLPQQQGYWFANVLLGNPSFVCSACVLLLAHSKPCLHARRPGWVKA